jgi:hypothetical protein
MLFILPQAARLSALCGLAAFRPPVTLRFSFFYGALKKQKGNVVIVNGILLQILLLKYGYHLLFVLINVIVSGELYSALP